MERQIEFDAAQSASSSGSFSFLLALRFCLRKVSADFAFVFAFLKSAKGLTVLFALSGCSVGVSQPQCSHVVQQPATN
jgi:hypothetical protein